MFNLSLSNHFGVECWNSYRSNYTRPIDIYVTNFLVMTLTNDENNFSFTTNLIAGGSCSFPTAPMRSGRVIPTFILILRHPVHSKFRLRPTLPPCRFPCIGSTAVRLLTTNLNLPFETNPTGFGQYPQPHWGLTMTNNLQVIMVDDDSGGID